MPDEMDRKRFRPDMEGPILDTDGPPPAFQRPKPPPMSVEPAPIEERPPARPAVPLPSIPPPAVVEEEPLPAPEPAPAPQPYPVLPIQQSTIPTPKPATPQHDLDEREKALIRSEEALHVREAELARRESLLTGEMDALRNENRERVRLEARLKAAERLLGEREERMRAEEERVEGLLREVLHREEEVRAAEEALDRKTVALREEEARRPPAKAGDHDRRVREAARKEQVLRLEEERLKRLAGELEERRRVAEEREALLVEKEERMRAEAERLLLRERELERRESENESAAPAPAARTAADGERSEPSRRSGTSESEFRAAATHSVTYTPQSPFRNPQSAIRNQALPPEPVQPPMSQVEEPAPGPEPEPPVPGPPAPEGRLSIARQLMGGGRAGPPRDTATPFRPPQSAIEQPLRPYRRILCKCGNLIPVYTQERPVRVRCETCGEEGVLR